jgi:hypothetical protein
MSKMIVIVLALKSFPMPISLPAPRLGTSYKAMMGLWIDELQLMASVNINIKASHRQLSILQISADPSSCLILHLAKHTNKNWCAATKE